MAGSPIVNPFRYGALALDDACGDPKSSRSRSSHAYAERIGGMGPEDVDDRGGTECDAYRSGGSDES